MVSRPILLLLLVVLFLIGCKQTRDGIPSSRGPERAGSTEAQSQAASQRLATVAGGIRPSSTSQTDTNTDPLIKLSPLTVPADWRAAIRQRYPKYLEAARKGEPMPEFDVQFKPLSQVEQGYATNTVSAREIILSDIADLERPATASALGRLFQSETNTELKVTILDYLRRMDGYAQQKLITFSAATKPGQPLALRKRAVDYLGEIKAPSAKTILESLLEDPSPALRQAAADALDELKTK